MKFSFRKNALKRELAKVSYYVYVSPEAGYYVCIQSDVKLYEDQLSKICSIIRKAESFNPAWKIAERIVTEIGNPVSKASFEYDEKNKKIQIELREWPY